MMEEAITVAASENDAWSNPSLKSSGTTRTSGCCTNLSESRLPAQKAITVERIEIMRFCISSFTVSPLFFARNALGLPAVHEAFYPLMETPTPHRRGLL